MKYIYCLIFFFAFSTISLFSQNDNLSYIADQYDSNKYQIQNSNRQTLGYIILNSYDNNKAAVYDANMNFIKNIRLDEINQSKSNQTSIYDPGTGRSNTIQRERTNFSIDPIQPALDNSSILRGIEIQEQRKARRVEQKNISYERAADDILEGYEALKVADYVRVVKLMERVDELKHPELKCDKYTLIASSLIFLRNNKYREYYYKAKSACPQDVTDLLNRLIAQMK